MTDYLLRKISGACTYSGCELECTDGTLTCEQHRVGANERTKKSQRRIRAERRARGECASCGVRSASYRCASCNPRKLPLVLAPAC